MTDIAKVEEIIERHQRKREHLIAMLLDCQETYTYLPREALETISARVGTPVAQVLGIATFFRAFSLKPLGRYPIQVCLGTACHVQGGPRLLDALLRELKVGKSETTEDLLFSVSTVNCLGCCGLAPVITIGPDVHGKLKQAAVPRLIKRYRSKAEKDEGKH